MSNLIWHWQQQRQQVKELIIFFSFAPIVHEWFVASKIHGNWYLWKVHWKKFIMKVQQALNKYGLMKNPYAIKCVVSSNLSKYKNTLDEYSENNRSSVCVLAATTRINHCSLSLMRLHTARTENANAISKNYSRRNFSDAMKEREREESKTKMENAILILKQRQQNQLEMLACKLGVYACVCKKFDDISKQIDRAN